MPTISESALTIFPPFHSQEEQTAHKAHDSPLEFTFDDPFEFESIDIKTEMAGASSPYIKSEPTDFNSFNPSHFQQHSGYMSQNNNNNNSGNFGSMHNSNNNNSNVDPNSIMSGGGFNQGFTSQNMSSSFMMGNSGIADDELMDTLSMNFDGNTSHNNNHNFQQQESSNFNQQQYMTSAGSVPMTMASPHHQHINSSNNNMYSSTPEGAPIQSPFINNFNYSQFRPMDHNQQQQQPFSLPTTSSGFRNGMTAAQQHMNAMERKISESRSPATPNTPGLGALHLGEPEYPVPGMQHQQQPRAVLGGHNRASSLNNWEGISNPHSWTDVSPYGSPANGQPMAPQHPQISEVLRSTSHAGGKAAASLPAKMEHTPALQTQEAKRRRRRESHNLVERRRRDNINERIHELASLVPQHRLEDEKVRKHLQTNSPLSPSITATGVSPPQATSLLAGGTGRRATGGNVTTGLPLDDKDKGPNKGDILNGSVAWTRDLLWLMRMKLEQEQQLKDMLQSQGHDWPFPQSEDEKRMTTELREVIEKNMRANNFTDYSRGPGTGLRVPGHTTVSGDPLTPDLSNSNQQSLSPGYQSGGSGMSSGRDQYAWQPEQSDLKEEDEFGFEM